ncbi:MAG TPA: DivIVA domain-containing protein [Actinomycetota bacterium]|nr:DivIVA domain-containing protein [Actinomycetota bacterium]
MDPEEIESREFLPSFRGYARDEVEAFREEVVQELKSLRKQLTKATSDLSHANAELEQAKSQLTAVRAELAEERAKPKPEPQLADSVAQPSPVEERATQFRMVGQETERILLAAEQAAEQIHERAVKESAEMMTDARLKVQRSLEELEAARRAAEEDFAGIRDARGMVASQLEDIRRRLEETINRLRVPVELPGAKPVSRFRSKPEGVERSAPPPVADRMKEAETQVQQRQAREREAAQELQARQTAHRAEAERRERELRAAEAQAEKRARAEAERLAAENAAREAAARQAQEEASRRAARAEVERAARAQAEKQARAEAERIAQVEAQRAAQAESQRAAEQARIEREAKKRKAAEEAAARAEAEARAAEEVRQQARAADEARQQARAVEEARAAAQPAAEAGADQKSSPAPGKGGKPAGTEEPAKSKAATETGSSLDELLEEIRRKRDEERRAEAPEPADVADARPAAAEAEIADALAKRNAALGDLPSQTARRLKRLLQEDHNDVLDRLRRQRGKGNLEDNLAPAGDQERRFQAGLTEALTRAFTEGRKAGGASGTTDVSATVDKLVSRQVLNPLRAEVSKAIEAGLAAEDSASALSERANDVFRVWKGVRTQLLGEGITYAAYHQGQLDAWKSSPGGGKVWVLAEDEEECPNDVCRRNAEAGAVDLKSPFPSGHVAPPAHGACTCTLQRS